MLKTANKTALGVGVILLLAACGGTIEDTPAQPDQRGSLSAAPVQSVESGTPLTPVVNRTAPGDGMAQIKQQLALLSRDVAEIRQQLARMPGTGSAVGAPDPRRGSVAREEAERLEQRRVASIESSFRGEKEDARWSQGATSAVRTALTGADESLRSQVRSIECRSHSCRVEINADAGGQMAVDLPLVVDHLGQALPNVTAGQIDQGDGRQATVLYLSR